MRKEGDELKSETLRATLFVPMTGEAEAQRKVKPDPANPHLTNGGFEESSKNEDGNPEPTAWHYQRQLTLTTDAAAAREGKRFVTFRNDQPGRGCHALQGFAIDGREVAELQLDFWARGNELGQGAQTDEWPRIVISFYDERRATVVQESTDPFMGTFEWTQHSHRIQVPIRAREAILRIGLLGAVGELSLDDIRIRAAN
jgi:protein-L-isoaspartate(D-aspartate) O-methyltransferase